MNGGFSSTGTEPAMPDSLLSGSVAGEGERAFGAIVRALCFKHRFHRHE